MLAPAIAVTLGWLAAAAPGPAAEPDDAPQVRAYGGPAYIADFGVIALTAVGVAEGDDSRVELAVATYALGAPLNHLANGYPQRALASVGIRALAAGAAFGVLHRYQEENAHRCDACQIKPDQAIAVASLLVLTGMLIDDLWLARETVPAEPRRASLAPGLMAGPGFAALSLGGTF